MKKKLKTIVLSLIILLCTHINAQSKKKLDREIEELVYHNLKVPYGKRFDIYLSDGTKVYLNSGTSLRYPVKFIKDNPREVSSSNKEIRDIINKFLN